MLLLRKVFYLLLILIAVVSGCSGLSPASNVSDQTLPQSQEAGQQPARAPLLKAKVTRVVDGDTVHVRLNGTDQTVRLIGVDTPETVKPNSPVQPYGKEASGYTRSQLEGKTVYIEKDVQDRDKYGRLLAYIWLDQPTAVSDLEIRGKLFNARLLLEGYAQILTIPPDVKYVDYFIGYQKEARDGNKGLWGPSAHTPPPQDQGQHTTVYITRTGKKYHLEGCSSLARSQIPISLPDAKAKGYGSCKVCKPPL
ncbi:MAG: hypothetical protein JL50_03190 [Peptococcaceae bacterium BICA1-7]|nr:MAG: hypothetical protein JL50_03190 [Peptococcaceae bacterium BICA1-7]